MSIEHKSSPDSWHDVWLQQASSTEIQHTQESQDTGNKLHKINNILWAFDFPDKQEDEYLKRLTKLDQEQFNIIQKLDRTAFQELLDKPENELLQVVIQTQIDELEKSNDPDFDKLEDLQKQLIALENQKQEKQQVTIATEKQETEENSALIASENLKQKENTSLIEAINKTDAQIAGLRGALLENATLKKNDKIISLHEKINLAESTAKNRDHLDTDGKELLQEEIQNKLTEIEEYLKSPWNLESIAKDLGWPKSEKYIVFKEQMLAIDWLNLQSTFDRVEIGFADQLAMSKLWTTNLDWVDTSKDILVKKQWDFTIEAWKKSRKLSLEWSNYKLPSTLDSKYEDQIEGLHQQSNKELAPFNTELNTLSLVLNIIKSLETNSVRFDEAKNHIKQKHPETYNQLGLSWKTSYWELNNTIQAHISQIERSKKKTNDKIKQKLKSISAQSKKEAQEKDRAVEEILKFLNSIWVDEIDQEKLTQIFAMVNINPASYGLQQAIDLENGSLGFDLDFWNKAISYLEKKAFIGFINKMLWEDVINEDIASGTTTLQPNSIHKIRSLNNNISGYFMANLNKQDI